MALVVNLKCVEGLPGKADRVAKISFRGKYYEGLGNMNSVCPFFVGLSSKIFTKELPRIILNLGFLYVYASSKAGMYVIILSSFKKYTR